MVLVFILLGTFILLVMFFILILLSTLQVEIQNLEVGNIKEEKQTKYQIKITFYFLEKIPIFWLRFNERKLKEIYTNKQLQKIDFKKMRKEIPLKQAFQILKILRIRIKKLKLQIAFGTGDAILTSYLIAIIGSIIGILLPHITQPKQRKECHYFVTPIYQEKNLYHIYVDSIICVKMVHIISIVCVFRSKKLQPKMQFT